MRTSTVLLLGGVGVLGYLWYRSRAAPAAALASTNPLLQDALSTGLEAGIAAGTYDANALRNAMMNAQPINYGTGQTSIAGYG